MDEHGFTREHLATLRQPQPSRDRIDWEAPVPPVLDAQTLLDQLTAAKAVFQEREVYQLAATLALHSGDSVATADHIARQAIDSMEAIDLGRDYRHSRLFTTRRQLAAEQALVTDAKALAADTRATPFAVPEQRLNDALRSQRIALSEEQIEAVLAVCQAPRFAILQGSAGAGKSASMACVRAAYEADNFHVIGAAIAKAAADNLAREAGLPTFTIAKLLSDIERGRRPLTERTVLIVDEAGLVGAGQLAALTAAAKTNGSKIILCGEDRQLDAIEHGGMLRYLSRPAILGTARIQTIRRQREDWARQAVADLRDGNALAALRAHHERGEVHFADGQDAAQAALIERWKQAREADPGKQRLVLAQRWQDVKELSEALRAIHRPEGSVAATAKTFPCIVGDHAMRLEFALGERVRFTRNDYALGLTNGATGTLVGLDERDGDYVFSVRGDDGTTRQFHHSDYCDAHGRLQLIHAYASTIYAAQGLTVDETSVLHDAQMDRALAYVAGSRHRDQCEWFCNNKVLDELHPAADDQERLTHLAKALSADRYHALALEAWERLPKVSEPEREQQRQHEQEIELA